jgi:glycosyltransferase involved in cell wall biosynthesis
LVGVDPVLYNLESRRLKVLFLASRYPNKEHPISGIFVKKHAVAVSKYCDIAVLYVHLGDIDNSIETINEGGITEIRVYRKASKYSNKSAKWLYNNVMFYLEYLWGGYLGYKAVKKNLGRPDLVHVNVISYAGLIGLSLKFFKGVPYLITEHWAGYFKEDGGFNKRSSLGKYMLRVVGKNAKAIITVSGRLRDAMIDCRIDNKFFIIPNVVDFGTNSIASRSSDTKKRMLHISLLKDDVKNVSGIIDAIEILNKKRDDFELHILGDGIDRRKLEGQANDYGLLDKVIFFHGMADAEEVAEYLGKSHFSILNSNFETFSVFAAESLACGKPVVATMCGGPEEFVNARCGILVEPKDTCGLAKAIEFMLDNYQRFASEEIAKCAKDRFSSDIIGEKIFEIYKDVLASR